VKLQSRSLASWRGVQSLFKIWLSVMLLTLAGHLAYATAPTAGTTIGNTASATYTDGSGTSRSVTSNQVNTVVQQVGSIALTANGAKQASPGSPIYYPHTITNNGNGTDTIALTAANTAGAFNVSGIQIFKDDGTGNPTGSAITSTPALTAGSTFKFIVTGTVPLTATAGQTNTITVTGTGGFNGQVVTNTDVTTVTGNAVLNLGKGISVGSGPAGTSGVTYTLTYTNNGNATATAVTLTDTIPTGMTYVAGSGKWSVGALTLTDTGTQQGTAPNQITYSYTSGTKLITAVITNVAPGQSGTISFNVNVNAGSLPAVNPIPNTASLSYNDGSGTTQTATSNTVNFTVTQTASVTLTGATVASANPGSTVPFTNVVTNTGNGTDTFNIVVNTGVSTFPAGTTFILYKADGVTPLVDTNGDGIPDTGPLAAGATYNVVLKATLPSNAAGAGPFTVTKTATSTVDPTKSSTGTDTLTSITASTVDLTNDKAVPANGGTATAADGLGITTQGEASAIRTNTVTPTTTPVSTTFKVEVNNTSGAADGYNLSVSTDKTFAATTLPNNWTVVFKADGGNGDCSTTGATVTNSGTINAGSTKLVCAVVTVPALGDVGALAGTSNLYFKAASPSSSAADVLHDAVTIGTVRSVTLTNSGVGQVFPGGAYVYIHTITNNGNVDEAAANSTITLSTADTKAGWGSVIYVDPSSGANGATISAADVQVTGGNLGTAITAAFPANTTGVLAAGKSITLLVKVLAPAGAQSGDSDTTTLSAVVTQGTYSAAAPTVTPVSDLTNVIAGNVTLVKAQALDAACAGPTGATVYSGSNISAGAIPGACILYQVTATNVGTSPATSVVISDATPAYTVYNSTVPAAVTVGTVTAPSNGSAGTISATVGTLAAGSSAVLTFGVKITQ